MHWKQWAAIRTPKPDSQAICPFGAIVRCPWGRPTIVEDLGTTAARFRPKARTAPVFSHTT